MMRKLVMIAFVVCMWIFLSAAAMAQDVRRWEIFGGFTYLCAETSPELDVFGAGHIKNFGWHGSISEYPWHWFGGTFDFSGAYGRPTITIPANYVGPGIPPTDLSYSDKVNTSVYTLMFGPSIGYRRNSHVKAFAHVLIGGVNGSSSLTSGGEILVGVPVSASEWGWGYAAGGGVDVTITKLVAVRGQADWIRSTFKDGGDDRQNNVRVSGGLVFRLGD